MYHVLDQEKEGLNLATLLYKSFAQAWTVIPMELSIDFAGLSLALLVKLAK